MTFPLSPVPLSLCHLDGSIRKSAKSILLKCLNVSKESDAPSIPCDISLIDWFYLLHAMNNLPTKYKDLSKTVLQTIIRDKNFKEVYIIFDQYITPSIKDYERFSRNQGTVHYPRKVSENSNRPTDFNKELRNLFFKKAPVEFFIEHWKNDEMLPYIGDKKLLLNYDECYVSRLNQT